MTGLVVRKMANETWVECIERYAKGYDLQQECLKVFREAVDRGKNEEEAALEALMEWDLCDLEE